MKIKIHLLYLISILALYSCQLDFNTKHLQLETAINRSGVVKNYSFDSSKSKVITYFGGVKYLDSWFKDGMPSDSLKSVVARYEDLEFLFYLRVTNDTDLYKAIKLMKRYDMELPIYIDDEDKFRDAHIKSSRTKLVTYVLGADNKEYLSGILWHRFNPRFEDTIHDIIKQIKTDNNGL